MRKKKSLSYKQAIDKCRQYQHLVGLPFEQGNPNAGTVKLVIIAPHNKILQWLYLSNIMSGMPIEKAIGICRDGKYTVLLVSSFYRPGQESVPPKYLHDYLAEEVENEAVAVMH